MILSWLKDRKTARRLALIEKMQKLREEEIRFSDGDNFFWFTFAIQVIQQSIIEMEITSVSESSDDKK